MKACLLAVMFASTPAEQALPAYPGALLTRVGDTLLIAGEPHRLAWFFTDHAPAQVAAHFLRQWSEAGYPVTAAGDDVQGRVVSAFFTREGVVRSIVLRRHQGRTLGLSVLKDAWAKAAAVSDTPLPPLEGTLFASEVQPSGAERPTRHRSAVVALNVEALRAARDAAWVRAGFQRVRETRVRGRGGPPQRVLEYARGREQAVVTLVEVDARTCALEETWVGAR